MYPLVLILVDPRATAYVTAFSFERMCCTRWFQLSETKEKFLFVTITPDALHFFVCLFKPIPFSIYLPQSTPPHPVDTRPHAQTRRHTPPRTLPCAFPGWASQKFNPK
jgi:hypothetical protein